MSLEILQQRIRRCKTPLALGLSPRPDTLPEQLIRRFEQLYGSGPMARTEALRYQGTRLLEAAEGLPAVFFRLESYLPYGAAGLDVLANLVSAAAAAEQYVIVDCCTPTPRIWLEALPGARAVTVNPYVGSDCCDVGDDQAVFALIRGANPSAGQVQNLMAGDRYLHQAVAEQMSRHGAGLLVETGFSLDIRELRRQAEQAMLLLTHCDGEAAAWGVDEYGHGALVVDETIQYAADPQDAAAAAVRELKQWITVV